MSKKTIAIIGAVNIDICGTADVQPVLHDSNPGNVNISFGGVGRNIAENLCHLGYKTEMITTLAEDDFSRQIVEAGKKVGIGFSHSMIIPGASCSTYISVNSNNKDMLVAVLGAGVVNKKVLEGCGIDSNVYSGIAFGIGIDRIAMLKYGINNIKLLFESDLRVLGQIDD